MQVNISNTSQSLVINTYYGFICKNGDKLFMNKKIDSDFNPEYIMMLIENISTKLNTKIINTSSHKFTPSGMSLNTLIESSETVYGSSGVAHLNESHISFHSYYENSIDGMLILRLELHISSCSRNSVFESLDVLSADKQYSSFDVATLDYFHRGVNLEKINPDKTALKLFLNNFSKYKPSIDQESTGSFENIKITKNNHETYEKSDYGKIIQQIKNFIT